MPINFEFKARTKDINELETKLLSLHPIFKGEDMQCDTYFNVPKGRLKLREGNIENALIYYERENTPGTKQSQILLYKHSPDSTLKEILSVSNGVSSVVTKQRKIYFIDNVKFHFDKIIGLGNFVEVEAIDTDGSIGLEKIKAQCDYYAAFFGIRREDYIAVSYSDLLTTNL